MRSVTRLAGRKRVPLAPSRYTVRRLMAFPVRVRVRCTQASPGVRSDFVRRVTLLARRSCHSETMSRESDPNCLFCKIIAGSIPSYKLAETEHAYAFLDIFPTSPGHSLVIPKHHATKLHEVPAEVMADVGALLPKVAKAIGAVDYNVLQNNGKAAHQEIMHVHFHIIPKPNAEEGLSVGWPAKKGDEAALKQLQADITGRL